MPALGRPTALALPAHAPAQLPAQTPARTPAQPHTWPGAFAQMSARLHPRYAGGRGGSRQLPSPRDGRWWAAALTGLAKGRRPGGAISVPIGAAWAAWPGRANSVTEGSSAPSGTAANVGSDGPAVPGKSRAGLLKFGSERACAPPALSATRTHPWSAPARRAPREKGL